MGAFIIKVGNWIYALVISFFNGQPIVLNSFWDICDILSNCKQTRIPLFCEVWIPFFSFLEGSGYHAEQA